MSVSSVLIRESSSISLAKVPGNDDHDHAHFSTKNSKKDVIGILLLLRRPHGPSFHFILICIQSNRFGFFWVGHGKCTEQERKILTERRVAAFSGVLPGQSVPAL